MYKRLSFPLVCYLFILLAACVPRIETTSISPPSQSRSPAPSPANTPQLPITPNIETSPTLPAFTETPEITEKPRLIQYGADLNNRVVSVNSIDSNRMAYCSPGEIVFSNDGGATWLTVSTAPVNSAAQSIGYQDFSGENLTPTCYQAFQDPRHEQSFYAVFSMVKPEYGAPPLFYMGFFTTDRGSTWQVVPPPDTSTVEHFGGFWSDGSGLVQALSLDPESVIGSPEPPIVIQTSDGGLTWSPGSLSCPPAGVCMRWGPAASMIPGMGSPLPQTAYYSLDDGESWQPIEPPVELRLAGPNQLIAFSGSRAARISGEIKYSVEGSSPLLITEDNGQTWMEYELPALPDASENQNVFPGLQFLPDGSLISQGAETASWYLLPAGKTKWCALEVLDMPAQPVQLTVSSGQIWWLTLETGNLRSTPLVNLVCQ